MAPQGYGYLQPSDSVGPYNPTRFIVQQALGRVRTLMLAQVKAVGTGTVDVQPLVSMVDSQGNAVPHGIIHGCPYLEMRAGNSAIVVVPVIGDVGLIAICDRDSSAAVASLAPGPPPSAREFDMADAIYVMGIAGGSPTDTITVGPTGISFAAFGNTIAITSTGITFTDAFGHAIVMNAAGITINGVNFSTHEHSGVTTGSGVSGPPV